MLTLLTYILCYQFFGQRFLAEPLRIVLLAAIIGMSLAWIANRFMKLSLHAAGAGGFVLIMFYLQWIYGSSFYYWTLAAILVAGLVGASRLLLKRHTPTELYLGYVSGILSSFLVVALDTYFST